MWCFLFRVQVAGMQIIHSCDQQVRSFCGYFHIFGVAFSIVYMYHNFSSIFSMPIYAKKSFRSESTHLDRGGHYGHLLKWPGVGVETHFVFNFEQKWPANTCNCYFSERRVSHTAVAYGTCSFRKNVETRVIDCLARAASIQPNTSFVKFLRNRGSERNCHGT